MFKFIRNRLRQRKDLDNMLILLMRDMEHLSNIVVKQSYILSLLNLGVPQPINSQIDVMLKEIEDHFRAIAADSVKYLNEMKSDTDEVVTAKEVINKLREKIEDADRESRNRNLDWN